MSLRLGDIAPNFEAKTTKGTFFFHEYLGNSWGVLFSHPADFTPVCTTELGRIAALNSEFEARNTKVVAISVFDLDSHNSWLADINEINNVEVQFPIIADESKEIVILYDMIHPNTSDELTVRSVFIIDPDKKIRLTLTYPACTGRNFDEILRVIDSLQLTSERSLATPADWKKGDDFIVSLNIPTEEIEAKYGQKAEIVKPYLRYIKG